VELKPHYVPIAYPLLLQLPWTAQRKRLSAWPKKLIHWVSGLWVPHKTGSRRSRRRGARHGSGTWDQEQAQPGLLHGSESRPARQVSFDYRSSREREAIFQNSYHLTADADGQGEERGLRGWVRPQHPYSMIPTLTDSVDSDVPPTSRTTNILPSRPLIPTAIPSPHRRTINTDAGQATEVADISSLIPQPVGRGGRRRGTQR